MPVEVILPKVDMDMATGQISRWFVAEGATVKKGDILFEIETDKAAMEIEAPAGGIIRDITGKEGIDIPVGEVVAWIHVGDDDSGAISKVETFAPTLPAAMTDGAFVQMCSESLVPVPNKQVAAPDAGQSGTGLRATPIARRLARDAGLNLTEVSGSGPHGRIVRADVEAYLAKAKASDAAPIETAVAADEPGGAASAQDHALNLFKPGSYELVPHDSMRRTIARRLVEAKKTIPHFYLTLDCNIDALMSLRSEINAAAPVGKENAQPAYKLSVNDMIIKAWALALRDVPAANVSWTESAMVRHGQIDVSVAVSVSDGLITPIIRNADQKTLSAISREMKELALRAKERKLRPDEYQGGTTSVSNLGTFGIRNFQAILNAPHATILAVGTGEERAVVRNGAVVAATMMSVSVSTDHRAVDGALAAELLAAFQHYIQNPLRLLV